MTAIVKNAKKELGFALQDLKSQQWFKELTAEWQDEAVSQLKKCFSPPEAMENTLINLTLRLNDKWDQWLEFCAVNFPWANPSKGNPEVNITKRMFLAEVMANG